MVTPQTERQRADKSAGVGDESKNRDAVDAASELHGQDRSDAGFDLSGLVAEYRALRASVIRLWREGEPKPDFQDVDDITRFNESIDQSLSEGVESFTKHIETCRDELTKAYAAQIGAEDANRAKDVFLATLSHELRTPLTAILGWAVLLRSRPANEASVIEAASVIERSAKMQAQLIDDVLDVSRIISGKLRLDVRRCELSRIVADAASAVRTAADAKGIKIEVAVEAEASTIAVDPGRIQQVVWNLLTNAVKFSPDDSTIDVSVRRVRSRSRITVVDRGAGIDPAFLPHVFERFRQADGSSRRQHGGLGLGLSIVRHLVEMHGGTAAVHSEGLGKGATFTVDLPVRAISAGNDDDDATATDEKPSEPEAATTRQVLPERSEPTGVRLDGLRVLVVDDEPDARNVIRATLEGAGATVSVADGAAAARAMLAGVRPHVLVSDISMPGEDGYDLMRSVRAMGIGYTTREMPSIALTAYARQQDRQRALMAGFQMHVTKPVDPHELTAVVASLAGRTG